MTTDNRRDVGARYVWVLVVALIGLSVAAGGYATVRWDSARIRLDKYTELAAVAELKSGQIVQWRQERLDDARNTAESPFFARAVRAWLKDPGNIVSRNEFLQRLRLERQTADCSDALLLGLDGRILLAAKDDSGLVDDTTMQAVTLAIRSRQAQLTGLFRQSGGAVCLDAVAAVSGANTGPIAVVVLRIDPAKFLFPLIQSWPIPSRSAETLLLRKDGNDIVFLNQLRHRAGTPLSFRIPLTRTDLPGVQAVAGKQGMFEGKDYRGVDVLGDVRPVPGSGWFMVAKIDASEILADVRYHAWVVTIVVILLILFAATAVAVIYRQRQAGIYRALYDSEREKRQTQESLRQSQTKLQEAHRLAHIGAWDWDVDSDTVTWTEELYRIAGFDPKLPAPTYAEHAGYYTPESGELLKPGVQRALETGEPYEFELTLIRPDGQTRCVNAFGGAKYNTEGQITGLHGIVQDITPRKQAEEALRRGESRSTAMLQAIPDLMFRLDDQGVYLDYKAAIGDLYAQSEASIIGKRNRDVTPPEFADLIDGKIRAALETRTVQTFEYQLPVPGRGVRDYEARMVAHAANEVTAIARDITDRKRADEKRELLEAQNRHLQKSESLGRMAGAIAHHFNNQLQVVTGNLELAQSEWSREGGAVQLMDEAMQATRRAIEVSNLMLTYLGQAPGKREPLDLSEACRRTLTLLQAAIPKDTGLEFDWPSPGPVVSANANQIQQVLANLVTNAWEAGGGRQASIRLTVKTVAPATIPTSHRFPVDWCTPNDACACLEVADAGCGIADDAIERLFDPFYSTKFTGRGMGLSVVLGIVRAHEGAIAVESAPGTGSIFRVYFPLTAEALPRLPEAEAVAPEWHASGTVLVVEDEDMVRTMTVAMLARLGFTVLAAKDGVEAVNVFRQHPEEIRCVLCDLTMPRMNGWETVTALRQIAPGLPVVLASGYGEAQVMAGAHAERPQAYLSKPYRHEELREAIRQALRA